MSAGASNCSKRSCGTANPSLPNGKAQRSENSGEGKKAPCICLRSRSFFQNKPRAGGKAPHYGAPPESFGLRTGERGFGNPASALRARARWINAPAATESRKPFIGAVLQLLVLYVV